MVAKLGNVGSRTREVSQLSADDEPCADAVLLILAHLQGFKEVPFLEQLQDVVEQWCEVS
ncbi:hypothetical protein [Blastococcus brunescens]|uniref:Uncharacterized protein n=1 Tax=Blastococcus brunescens TaxID=1564165 RepID=A0ABZ1B5Y3_9ACTN|nr:hypothetical protein [Blastococcus sp. BMG 8361]WRL66222.1 hypothetical protein U6N30_12525 [Blastococcus sp. BMG 8361]